MSNLFNAFEAFTSVFSEDINHQANVMMMSLFAFLNAFTREEHRYNHMVIINNFCTNILLHYIKTADISVSIVCKILLFEIQHQISLKLKGQNKGHFENPFGRNFYIFRKNVNDLISLIRYLKLTNCVDIEINYDSVMLSRNIKDSLYTFLEHALNVCNAEGARAQLAMPNVLAVIESL